jgi:endonuclease/exonuclease/phosphatase family metal-dependent hydrolase
MKKLLRNILLYVNIAFVVFLLLSFAASYVSPVEAGFIAVFGLAFPFLLLINLLFILMWLFFKKKYAFLSLVAILIGWNKIPGFFQLTFNTQNIQHEDSFKILSYNVRLFDLYKWTKKKGTKEKIVYFLKEEKPDILCIQEYYSETISGYSTNEKIREYVSLTHQHIGLARNKFTDYKTGVATFSKYPIIKTGEIRFRNTNNICIFSDIAIQDTIVRVYNTHLESLHLGHRNHNFIDSLDHKIDNKYIPDLLDIFRKMNNAFQKRSAQAEELQLHIDKCPYPVVLCGDFNDTPVSYAYRRIRRSLNDAFIESGNGFGNTYYGKFLPFRIDYILHSDQLIPSNFVTPKIKLSDHYPLYCHFTLKKK